MAHGRRPLRCVAAETGSWLEVRESLHRGRRSLGTEERAGRRRRKEAQRSVRLWRRRRSSSGSSSTSSTKPLTRFRESREASNAEEREICRCSAAACAASIRTAEGGPARPDRLIARAVCSSGRPAAADLHPKVSGVRTASLRRAPIDAPRNQHNAPGASFEYPTARASPLDLPSTQDQAWRSDRVLALVPARPDREPRTAPPKTATSRKAHSECALGDGESASPPTVSASERYGKYFRLLRVGVPHDAAKHKTAQAGTRRERVTGASA